MKFYHKSENLGDIASLINAKRLATKQDREYSLAKSAEKIESKMPKTSEALGQLGAGKPYGA